MLHDKYAYVKTVNRDWALILRGLSKKIKGASILQLTPLVSLLIGWKAYLNLILSPKRGQSQKALSEGFRINLHPWKGNRFYLLGSYHLQCLSQASAISRRIRVSIVGMRVCTGLGTHSLLQIYIAEANACYSLITQ